MVVLFSYCLLVSTMVLVSKTNVENTSYVCVSSLLLPTKHIFLMGYVEKPCIQKNLLRILLKLMSTALSHFSWNICLCYDCCLVTTELIPMSLFLPWRIQHSNVSFHVFTIFFRAAFHIHEIQAISYGNALFALELKKIPQAILCDQEEYKRE